MARARRSSGPRRRTKWVNIEASAITAMTDNDLEDRVLLQTDTIDFPVGATVLQTRLYVSALPKFTTGAGYADFTTHFGYLVTNAAAAGAGALDPNSADDSWMLIDSLGYWVHKPATAINPYGAFNDGRAKWLVSNARRKIQEGDALILGVHNFVTDGGGVGEVVDIGFVGRVLLALP